MDAAIIKTEPISSPLYAQTHEYDTTSNSKSITAYQSCIPLIKQEAQQDTFVSRAATPPVKTTKDEDETSPLYAPSLDIKQEAHSDEEGAEDAETERTSETATNLSLCHPHITPLPAPSSQVPKTATKRSPKHPSLFLKLRCLRALPHASSSPQTPLNTSHPLFMTPARNGVRCAAFEEHVRVGVTPLLGKGSQVSKRKRRGRNVSDILKGGELKVPKSSTKDNGEKESLGLLWFKRRLWGRGRWATRSKS